MKKLTLMLLAFVAIISTTKCFAENFSYKGRRYASTEKEKLHELGLMKPEECIDLFCAYLAEPKYLRYIKHSKKPVTRSVILTIDGLVLSNVDKLLNNKDPYELAALEISGQLPGPWLERDEQEDFKNLRPGTFCIIENIQKYKTFYFRTTNNLYGTILWEQKALIIAQKPHLILQVFLEPTTKILHISQKQLDWLERRLLHSVEE